MKGVRKCYISRCTAGIPKSSVMCQRHWNMTNTAERNAIVWGKQRGAVRQSADYVKAVDRACQRIEDVERLGGVK